jgi:alpha-tubulin suppressor-like RCC1 family protein
VTAVGDVFSWGSSERGQLGHGDTQNVLLPKQIALKVKLKQVSCGSNHTLLLARDGQLYSCGGDDLGQLGHGDSTNQLKPRQLDFFQGRPVEEAVAGAQHSHAVTASGELFGWGCSHHGRLGVVTAAAHHAPLMGIRTSKTYCGIPQRVKLADVRHASAGTHHTLAVTRGGELYSFGSGEGGRLGLGEQSDVWEPKRVPLGVGAVMAAAGTSHSVVLTEDQEVYTFGSGGCGELGHGDRATLLAPQKVAFFSQLKATDPPGACHSRHGHGALLL